MPAIRDFARAATTVATGTTLVLPVPNNVQGDLLVAIIAADTQTTETWTNNQSYTHLTTNAGFANTCGLYIAWKYAGANEVDVTFTRSASESFNGVLISIRDVHATVPFAGNPNGYLGATQAAAATFTMPALVTTVNNSLLLYASANSTLASVPSIILGPAQLISGQDGVAESLGVSWGFMRTAGTSPGASVTCANVATGAGYKVTLAVQPPAGGAQVIPGYTVSDASIYVSPLHSNIAYNGGTGVAATATTYFGASTNGVTLSNGTVSSSTTAAPPIDYGINNYHSVATLTGSTTAKTWAGATMRPPATINIANKNLLVHIMPSTPKQLQSTAVSTATHGGIAFGMASGTANANYKIWHVHGAETSWAERRVPCIINSGAAGTIQNTGTLDGTVINTIGFFISSFGGVAPVWTFASLWALDTCIISGGNSTEPLDIPGIVTAYATGHERYSALQQGSGQVTFYGPIQLGNGGTAGDNMYLDMAQTATEFPAQYVKAKKLINYNSTDNIVGITFYPGASDTIDIRSATFSSINKYHWKWHASASSSATLLTSGCQVINAGTVTLPTTATLTGVTFTGCSEIVAQGGALNSCSFNEATGSTGAISITGSSQAALQTALNNLTSCNFSNNILANYGNTGCTIALRINYTGAINSYPVGTPLTLSMSTGNFSGNTIDIHWESTNTGNYLKINKSGTANPDNAKTSSNLGTGSTYVSIVGTYALSILVQDSANNPLVGTTATATGGISGTTMTLASVNSGTVAIGMTITGSGVSANTRIVSGSGLSWVVNVSQNVTVGTALTMNGGPRVAVYLASNMSQIIAPTYTNGSGVVTGSYASTGNIIVRVRHSSGVVKYLPQNISGTISAQGYNTTVSMLEDSIVK